MLKSIFRNSSGTRYLNALFYETTGTDKSTVVYTLKDKAHEGYPSLKEKYLEADDLTEYRFAVSYLDGWEHWQMLCNCSWFQEYLEKWRAELKEKVRSRALSVIRQIADGGEKDALAANKYLLETLRKPVDARKVGRPRERTTQAQLNATRLSNEEINTIEADYARLVKGVG